MTERLVLHTDAFWISPYVFSCFVTLREKGLAFEIATVPLQEGAHRRPEFRDKSITARVPALDHGDFRLGESSAIIDYLEEAFPAPQTPSVYPERIRDRARARQILAWVRSDLGALREERSTTTMFYEPARTPLTPAGRAAADKLLRVADLLVPADGGPLFGSWSIADADLAFMLHRLIRSGDDVPARIRAWAGSQWSRPSVREFVEHPRDPYVPYG